MSWHDRRGWLIVCLLTIFLIWVAVMGVSELFHATPQEWRILGYVVAGLGGFFALIGLLFLPAWAWWLLAAAVIWWLGWHLWWLLLIPACLLGLPPALA